MGRSQRGQPIDGILLLDKPAGITSNRALQAVRRHLDARKAGHTGSLDPAATGLLPLCFGHATRLTPYLLDADKTYAVTAELGVRTDSGDLDGHEIERVEPPELSAERWNSLLNSFLGPQQQIPPMYSALKHDGRRLYTLARQGVDVERPPRSITIHAIQFRELCGTHLKFEVRCSKGTYIRSLVEDIAQAAGTIATTAELRRLGAGPFDGSGMKTLDAVKAASQAAVLSWLLPLDAALPEWPAVALDRLAAEHFEQGQAVQPPENVAVGGHVRVHGSNGGLIGLGEIGADGLVSPKKVFGTTQKPS
ncbi:MAG: tRNA pseudouridine(55) synthase TruB [Pseudomonadota bacterium]